MARPATGSVVEPKGARKSWGLRFRVSGKREFLTLGRPEDGWNRRKADEALKDVLAEVQLGTYEPPRAKAAIEVPDQAEETFHAFAEGWYADHVGDWRPSTERHFKWCLQNHLLGWFGEMRLSAITIEDVDRYARAKQREGSLSNNTINKTLVNLGSILGTALEYGRIPTNPAAGQKRRLRGEPKKRLHVEPEQLMALLRACHGAFRPLVATLAGAGLRISEATALRWADINLAAGTVRVRQSKTAAGIRVVDMPIGLADDLRAWKARTQFDGPKDYVFRSQRTGGPQTTRNAQRRIKVAVRKANETLADLGIDPISEGVSPHSLRRTFASVRFAAGDDPVYVAEQGGWEDPAMPLRVYAKSIRRRSKLSGAHLKAFDEAIEWAHLGTKAPSAQGANAAIPDPERIPAS